MPQRLRDFRIAKGWSLHTVAKKADLSKATLSHWENGKVVPTAERLIPVLKALGVNRSERLSILESLDSPNAASYLAKTSPGYIPLSADLIAGLRLRRGRSVDWLADAIGVSRNSIRAWERGELAPLRRREQIARALKADPITYKAIVEVPIRDGSLVEQLLEQNAETGEWQRISATNWAVQGDLCTFYRIRSCLWRRAQQKEWSLVLHDALDYAGQTMWSVGYVDEAMRWWRSGLRRFETDWRTLPKFGRAIVFKHLPYLWTSPAITASRLREDCQGVQDHRAWALAMSARAYALSGYRRLALECLDIHSDLWEANYGRRELRVKEEYDEKFREVVWQTCEPTHYRASVYLRLGEYRHVLDITRTDDGDDLDPAFSYAIRADAAMRLGDWQKGASEMEEADALITSAPVAPSPLRTRAHAYMRHTWIKPLRQALENRCSGDFVGSYRNWPEDE